MKRHGILLAMSEMNRIQDKIHKIVEIINTEFAASALIRFDEPLSLHSTFKVGGPSDVWIQPCAACFPEYAGRLCTLAKREGVPLFILGGGANIVFSDKGLRGIVLDTGGWTGVEACESGLVIKAGTAADDAANEAAERQLSGLEFLAGLPGSIGGAIWMNARCYERSISDVLRSVETIDEAQYRQWRVVNQLEFGYKQSPFQKTSTLILAGCFTVHHKRQSIIVQEMQTYRADREQKGHFRYPSAGSVFKNNHAFGKPTGKLLDELGLKGLQQGGAQISPWHGNIIINTGNATAAEIHALTLKAAAHVKEALSLELEPELLFVGDFRA
ncbi:UDP-N-acetylmuramate dehydrogenase [Breznakiellaceae bacterium SP9]